MSILRLGRVLSEKTCLSYDFIMGFVTAFIKILIKEIERKETVTIRGLGNFYWHRIPPRNRYSIQDKSVKYYPANYILKFKPSRYIRRASCQTKE